MWKSLKTNLTNNLVSESYDVNYKMPRVFSTLSQLLSLFCQPSVFAVAVYDSDSRMH